MTVVFLRVQYLMCLLFVSASVCGLLISYLFSVENCLQCFDAVGWVAGRASGL